MISGEYQDILNIFSEMLNFQMRQFKRMDGGWGSFNEETKEVFCDMIDKSMGEYLGVAWG